MILAEMEEKMRDVGVADRAEEVLVERRFAHVARQDMEEKGSF